MKKLWLVLLLCVLLTTVSCGKKNKKNESDVTPTPSPTATEAVTPSPTPSPEPTPTEAPVSLDAYYGAWYADRAGVTLTLQLNEDGSYTLSSAFSATPLGSGRWRLTAPYLYLGEDGSDGEGSDKDGSEKDGDRLEVLSETRLRWSAADVVFTREKTVVYAPAELEDSVALEFFAGYWKSSYVALNDSTVSASVAGDNTDIFIDGSRVALGGDLFHDAIVDMKFENGQLSWSGDGLSVTIGAQTDGLLRVTLTVNAGDGSQAIVLYLAPEANE